MELQIPVVLNGVVSADKKGKPGEKRYTAHLYAENIGAFEVSVTPDEFVRLSNMRGQSLALAARVVIKARAIPYQGRTFDVYEPGLQLGELSLPENAVKLAQKTA